MFNGVDNDESQYQSNFKDWYDNFADVMYISLIFLCFSIKKFEQDLNGKKSK